MSFPVKPSGEEEDCRHGGGQKGGQQTKGKIRAEINTKFHRVITKDGGLIERIFGKVKENPAADGMV
ncbi:MAG: hypothetical protein LBP81_02655 [Treponema sp.]|jgi:hypothetical protein|nr:hypothetical protein [Treponema sp.]